MNLHRACLGRTSTRIWAVPEMNVLLLFNYLAAHFRGQHELAMEVHVLRQQSPVADEDISRLRNQDLGRKRSLAIREFAVGIEAYERFVPKGPLRRVRECAFGG